MDTWLDHYFRDEYESTLEHFVTLAKQAYVKTGKTQAVVEKTVEVCQYMEVQEVPLKAASIEAWIVSISINTN